VLLGRKSMEWYLYVAYFFGGAFLVNAVPHFTEGLCGRSFPSPFASPPGKGLSSPTVNMFWGAFNLIVAYLLICRVGEFSVRQNSSVIVLGVGGLLTGVQLSRHFGSVNRGK
jgi:hypothetical protein